MASKWRNLEDLTPEQIISASQVKFENPRAQRLAQSVIGDTARQAESRQREIESAQKKQAKAEAKAAKEAADAAEAQRAMQVRAGAAAGMKTETDIQTGKRSIATHPDGAPVWKAGPQGDPIEIGTQSSAVKLPGEAQPTTRPFVNPLMAPTDGALGATGGTTQAAFGQPVRDDRGNTRMVQPDTTTDAKTGRQYVSKTDPTTGATVKTAVGIDQAAYDKIQRDQQYQAKAQEIDLRDNNVKQARMRFDPQFKPVADEFTAAKKEVEALPPVFTKQGAVWKYTDPQTLKEVTTFDTAEVERNKALRAKAEQRLATAQQAYERMSPTASNLERNEKEIKESKLKLESDRLRQEAGLPEDDGGAAELIAYDNLLKENKIGADWTPEKHKQVFEHLQGGGQIMADGTLSGGDIPEGTAPAAPGQIEDRPLIPQDTNKAAVIADQFQGLVKPEEFTIGESGQGFTFIKRNGEHVGRVVTEVGEKSLKQPVFVVNDNLNQNADIRQMIAFGGTKGMDIYLGSNARPDPVKESEWTAGVFGSIRNAQEQGFPAPAISAMLKEAGADQLSIFRKVRNGELSVQRGEAIMRDLYGSTLKADDPIAPGAIDRYMAEQAEPELRDQWAKAKRENDTAGMNAATTQYLNQWYVENQMKPGVNFQSRLLAEQGLMKGLRTGEKAGAIGTGALNVAGSMVGMLAAAPMLGTLKAMQAMGDETAGEAADAAWQAYGRGSKNVWRGWDYNRKRWLTDEGEVRFKAFEAAGRALQTQIRSRDSYPDGIDSPAWKEGYTSSVKAIEDAALQLHQMGQEKGWEITREDLERLSWMPNAYALTGDKSLLDAYFSALTEDHGTRQAAEFQAELTNGLNPFMAGVIGGAHAPPEEIGIEIVSTLMTAGASKVLLGGAKTAQAIKAAKNGVAATGRLTKLRMAAHGMKDELIALGTKADTLADPLTKGRKALNTTVQAGKVALGSGVSEFGEEAAMGLSERDATLGSVIEQGGIGFLAGFVMAPVMGGIAGPIDAAKRKSAMEQSAKKFAEQYNKAGAGQEGFIPLTPQNALMAMSLSSPQQQAALQKDFSEAVNELAVTSQAASQDNASDEALNALSRAQQRVILSRDNLATFAAARAEAVQAVEAMPAELRPQYGAALKVATGRTDLLTQAERSAAGGMRTQSGQPYFANVGGVEVLTDEARAEIIQNAPALGALIQTTESQALLEAQAAPESTAPLSQQAEASGAEAGSMPPIADAPGQGTPSPVANGATTQPSATELEAAEYEAARQQNPALPEIGQAVSQAFAAGRPVSVSMQKAAGVDVPDGYARQGAVWMRPQQAQSADANSAQGQQDQSADSKPPVSSNTGPVENQTTTGENAPETPDKDKSRPGKENAPPAKQSPAHQVAEQVKANVEASMPRLKGRIVVSETTVGSGGATMDIESGIITLHVDDIAKAIQRSRGDLEKAALYLENIVARHEAVHVVQVDSIRSMWEEEGSPGEFTDYFDSFYDQLGAELLTPEAIDAARKIYGQNTDGTWKFDQIASRGLKAAEFTRMLVEAKMDGSTAQFSELLRVVKNQGAKSKIARIIFKAIQILRGMQLTPAAEAHVQQLVELHAELSAPAAKTGQTPGQAQVQESAQTQQPQAKEPDTTSDKTPDDPNALRIVAKGDGKAELLQGSTVLDRGTEAQMQAALEELEAAQTSPLLITGNAIKAALEKFPRLAGKLRAELEDAADEVTDELESAPPGERMALAEKAIADRINLIADREAERTGKDRMEVIEGFRAVAGKRAAKQAASIESAVVGKEAPQIPTGRQEKRDTPNSEMSIDVTSTYVDLDQLIGSSDPLFPGSALQPRNRATQASQNQREEMVQNIRDKDDQHRRYIEGATTDSGRMVVAPLFSADGTHMTNEAGKPLFYVISGNGRRNALKEAASRNVSGKIMKGFRETAASEGIDVDGMTLPVPVSVFVPSSAKEAIDLAEYSNRDAQLSVSNTEQSVRDAASIEKAGILKLWEPDNTGDAAAASNRDFVKAFARAVGDEGVIDNAGNLTEEGAKRIERAMVAMLLGSEQATLLDILFNRASPLGLRAILGGVASETGALLKLASSKPDFDLSPVLANALKTAVEAKQAVSAGQFRDVSEFFDQGSLFESTENTPERQLARAIVESRSRKAVREILAAYRKGAEAVDTSTMSMFAEAETTREDLILKALEARPIEQVIAEIEAEFGKSADLPAKLRVGVAAIKRLDAAQRREFTAAIGAEADRLRAGMISAVEWQRLNPDALGAKEALFQRFLDSHDANTIASGFNRLLTPKAQAVLGSSAEQVDPRLTKEFGENFEADEYGLPKAPVTLPDGHPLLDITKGKKTATLLEDHPLVVGGYLPAGQVSRKELGRAIIRYFMEHGTQLTGKPTPLAQGTRPVVYATGGGGGAGKSTILKFLQKRGDIDLTGAVLVNADDIKEMIPEFEEMKRLGDGRAAATVHEESSQLAKNLLDVLLNPNAPQRFNFIYDATLGHPESSRKYFDRWKSVGYLIHFIGVTIDPKEAMIRAVLRGKGSGRWVPSHMLAEAHQGFNRGVDEYIRMSDMANLVDNTPPEFHEIGKKSQGEDTISIVNAEYLAILRSRESDVPKTSSQARSRLQGMAGGESGGRESGGRSPIRQVQSEGGGSGSQGTGGLPGESSRLGSSAEQADLFGGIEEAITGPRAKAKRNALEQMRKAPPKAQAGIAKQIAKREGLEDLDLFAAAAVRNLDAKPRRGEAAINASGSGQLGFDFDSGTPAGQQADATRRAGGIRADQATPGRASRSGEQASQPAGEGAASDVQGADSGRSGSGDGSLATDSRDGRGGRAESGNRQGGGQDGRSNSPEAGKRKLVERERPPVGSPERNFTIGKDTVLAEGGTVTRLRNNLAAIDLLRTLEKEGRNATAEEKAVLARYVGWGGIPQVFDEMMFRKVESGEAATRRDTANTYERYGPAYVKMVADYRDQADAIDKWNQKWGDHYRKLKEMLSPEEWTSAQESTINAHYTSPKVISAMWDAVKRLGFLGGNILEPAGGVGHYFGLMPPSIAKRSQLFGVELDSISGRIFGKLYPEGQIEVTGFQDSTIPDNSQSLVISNVPFANINISDAYLDANPDAPKFNLHNYFFEKALRVAQPGGLIAFITTSHTMDSQIAQRKWLAERADFLGAIRLPNNAFKENANTEVVTDIIFLRKPDGTPNPVADSWTATAEVPVEGGKVAINEYFARHPEMILGRLANDGSMYNGREEMTVHGNGDLAEQLREAIARLPENVVGDMESAVIERLSRENAAAKDGAFIEENGKLVIKGTGEVVEAKQSARVRSFITLRDTLNSLYLMESDPDATDADISRKRAELNRAYDTFRVIHKELHNPANKKVLSTDPDFYRTLGLETPQKSADGTKTTFTKADVFTKRILEPRVEPTSAESIEDAMIQSLRWKGRLDTKFVGKLMNLTRDQAENQLLGLPNVFRNPATGMLEQSTGYLAGNVRRKLRDAELAAQTNPEYTRNVEELRAAMPADVDWADIQYKIGSTWIPAEVYQDFLREKLMNGTGYPEVIYNKGVGEIIGDSYVVNSPASYRNAIDEQWGVMTKGGAVDKSAFWIAEKVLNQEDPRINRTVEKKQVYDAEATETARASAERMADAFIEWVDANPDLQERLHKIYNESFNSHVIPKYDGSFMQLPWVAKDFDLYPSKKHVVWRALQEGSMLVAHGVGGGKTIIGTAVAMEVRRLGLAKKPMIVVHNATLEQFATTITQMAPTARVLVARKEDLAGGKRKEFMGRIRSGDWDAVVMAHSTFDLIPDDPAWERQQVNELLEELDDAIRAEGADPNETEIRKIKEPSVKELVKMRKRLKDKISKLQDRKTDDVLTFQELGIDTVIVDEAHRYKKMPFVTRQSNIAGIDTGSSQRGTAMHLRSKWIQAQNGGRGVYTMTGTPVTNTLGESWNMIRLVRPDLLKEFAVQTFDRFVSVFGNIKQSGELRPNGQYKPVTRLAEFTNIPEWNRFWGLAADVKMGDDMDVKGRPKIKGGKPALTAVERTPQVAAVIAEITKVIDAYDKMTGKEKRENSHVPLLTYAAARMAAIDVRLVNPEAADDPGSKVNAAIANVMRIYKDTGDNKGTQVIFSDSYRPLKTTKLDLSAAEFEQKANEAVSETESEEGFNLYHDIREKLVKAGVPRSEIAIIGEAKNDKQREIMFEKVNTGEIRIIMGSTETLGTGVNMQKRMFAAHHLDVPWTPAGLEQRDGRVFRQGNMWAGIGTGEIEIMRYGMKDTLDAALWQKLETKERMIKQAVSGEVNARVIEDDAGLLNYMEQKAALSGADGMLKFELDDAVRQFKNQFRTHRNRDYDLKKAMIRAQAQIDAAERNLPELRQAAELVAPLRDVDAQEVGWSIEVGETLKGEKARKALDEMFKARRKKAGAIANAETAPSLRESIRATANGVPVVFRVATISEDLANVANPDQRWQIAWQAYFPGYESASSQASPHPGSNLSAVPALVRNIVAAPDSMERAAAQARKDIENFKSESGKPFPKLAEFRKTLIDQAALYDRMGISRPEGDDLYQNVIGEGWQEKLKGGDKTARAETPANYPGAGLAPQAMTLGSSEESAPDLFTATRRPDASAKLGQVKVGTMNALGAYRTLTAKREKLGKLTAKEEQQLLDAEVALGQKLAFDMDALKTKTAPPDMRPAIERSTSRMDYSQMEMSRYGETDRKGQMALLSSEEQAFYSQLERVIDAKVPNRATPEQIMATVNAAGVKAEEIKWSGIEQALVNLAVDGKVSKDTLLAYLADEGAVRFEEVELTGPDQYNRQRARLGEMMGRGEITAEEFGRRTRELESTQRESKFSQYTLPGGENYREVVLAMPPVVESYDGFNTRVLEDNDPKLDGMTPDSLSRFWFIEAPGQLFQIPRSKYPDAGDALSFVLRAKQPTPSAETNYTSSHFPDVPNYVAHMRVNERTDAAGAPGLFIEEIQSDRHQAGRKSGYKGDFPENVLKAAIAGGMTGAQARADISHLLEEPLPTPSRPTSDQWRRLNEAVGDEIDLNEVFHDRKQEGIPDAPFRTTWPLAMFKRALRDAVDSGKDWIGWTTGATQGDRFDLSKQVAAISVDRMDNGRFNVDMKPLGRSEWEDAGRGLDESKLADTIGKDLAQKVIYGTSSENPRMQMTGDQLKVESAGMKGFYDNMLPKEIGKYVKQWGGKVEKSTINKEPTFEQWVERVYGKGEKPQEWMREKFKQQTTPIWRIDITPEMRKGVSTGQALFSSAEEDTAAVEKALASMKPIHRAVFEAVNSGMTPEQVMAKYSISSKAVSNILDQVRSRIASVMKATTADGLTPAMRDGKFDGGRPDLALSTIPQVAAIDQIRNDSGLPGVRAWADILPEAERMLAGDYQGTYDRMLAKARNMEQMSDLEVAATKMLISRETMEGRASTPAERVKLALLIHGYRDIGTETARSLAIRRDPHKTPAQRHAQFIAEALFTPDEATRKALRDATPGQQEEILSSWMRRVDAIKQELKARGLDLDASLAAFNEKETARKEAEADSPRTAAIIETQIRKLNRREKAVIEAIRSGSLITKAAYLTGLSTDEVKAIYLRFQADMEAAMAAEAKRYMAGALGASADSAMTRIMTDLGLPPLEMIDDTAPDFEAIRKRAKRKEAKPRKPKEKDQAAPKAETKTKAEKMLGTGDKPLTPKQLEAIERFVNAEPSTWKAIRQETAKLFPQSEGFPESYQDGENARRILGGMLFPEPINETTGIFDLNDPKAMMEVRNAFALARGTKMDAIMEFWRMSILTGPQTHLVNMGSNALYAAYNLLPRRAVEAGANTVLSAIGMGSQEAATFGEFSAMAKNLRKAIQLGARQALTSWALETRTFESYAEGASLQMDFTGVGGENFEPKLGGKLGKVMRSLSFRAMTAADEFMKLTYGQLEAAANAHRIAKVEEKLTGAAYETRITELMQPGSVAWLRAMDGAKRITFQEELNGNNPKAIARIDQFAELAKKGRAMPWIGRPLTFFLPFIDTPTNIVKQAIEMSPLGGFLAVIDGTRALRRRYLRGNMSKAEAELAAGELYNRARFVQDVTNQTIAWTAYFALSGLVKPDDDDEDGRPVITGTQPYKTTKRGERDNAYAVMPPQSIRIGGTMFSYARIEPFASMLAGVVDLMQEIDRNGGTLNGAAASAYAMRLKDQFKDKTFLQGVSDILNAIEDPERFAENTTANIISGFVPNIIRQPIREADDVIRDSQPREDQGFFGAVARRVGYSVAPQMAPVKMDVWGNEIRANRGKDLLGSPVADKLRRTLDPLNSSFGADADPLDAWIFQFNRLTADSSDRIGLSPIPAYITGTVEGKRTRIPLTPEEQAEANRNAGQAARSILGDDWDWKTAGTDTALQRAEMIKQVVEDAQKFERARLRAQKLMEMTE